MAPVCDGEGGRTSRTEVGRVRLVSHQARAASAAYRLDLRGTQPVVAALRELGRHGEHDQGNSAVSL